MQEKNILRIKSSKQTVWNILCQVPGLSETLVTKICTVFQLKRNTKIGKLTEDKVKELEKYILKNFLVGYKLIRKITQATTLRFISRSRRGIRSRHGLPINGQRTHSNGKTPRRLRGLWVLPEVLRNPIAFFNFNKDEKKRAKLVDLFIDLQTKPKYFKRTIRKRWGLQKKALHERPKLIDLSKKILKTKDNIYKK